MRKIILATLATILAGPALAAGDYCRPHNGKNRIAKTGACPSGYFTSGDCCEAYHRDTPAAFPKIEGRTCPTGTFASGGACGSFR